jgi:hypothetical protein
MLHPPQLDPGRGEDDYVPEITPDDVESGHGVEQGDTQIWKNKRISQCGCIEMMSMVDNEARSRRFAFPWLPLLNCSSVYNVELLFLRS